MIDLEDPLVVAGKGGTVLVLPELKTLFVSVAKNGCTSLKWMLADLAGEDLSRERMGLRPYVSDEHVVHIETLWKHAFAPARLDPALRGRIRPDNGWFVFGVVRDPRERLFSAWQDKLLLQSPGFTRYRGEPWFPRMPTDAPAVIEDFARFVDWGVQNTDHRLFRDHHFRPQTVALKFDAIRYSRIYDIRELGQLRADLLDHVRAQGWTGEFTPRRSSNETPLRAVPALFADGVREKIEKMYAADFERFGERWDFSAMARNPDWTPEALERARLQAAYGRRLGDVRDIALRNERRAARSRSRAQSLRAELAQARRELERARRGAGRAADVRALPPEQGSPLTRARSVLTRAARRVRRSRRDMATRFRGRTC